jgi:hypothetical protein
MLYIYYKINEKGTVTSISFQLGNICTYEVSSKTNAKVQIKTERFKIDS